MIHGQQNVKLIFMAVKYGLILGARRQRYKKILGPKQNELGNLLSKITKGVTESLMQFANYYSCQYNFRTAERVAGIDERRNRFTH
jgi:hypothetical protein